MTVYLQVSTKVTLSNVSSSTKVAFSFDIPDHKSGKVGTFNFKLEDCMKHEFSWIDLHSFKV